MNKEYIYIAGKVIVTDENGTQNSVEYYDNLDEVLIQENLIETMEDKISKLEKESKDYKKYNKKHYIPIVLPLSILTTTIGIPAIAYLLGDTDVYVSSINTIFGPINRAVLYTLSTSTLLPFISLEELRMYRDHKNSIKEEKGINSELEFLKQQIIIEKQKLSELKKEKTKNRDDKEFKSVEVDDLEKLKALKSYLNLYYDLGYNGEKYYKYYLQGKLDNKLCKYYNDIGIELAKEYLEEKGHTLVKKKNTKK